VNTSGFSLGLAFELPHLQYLSCPNLLVAHYPVSGMLCNAIFNKERIKCGFFKHLYNC
jgi:hypothetical protein